MTTNHLDAIERALEQLAREFATQLVAEVFQAEVSGLGAVLRAAEAFDPGVFAIAPGPPRSVAPTVPAPVAPPAAPVVAAAPERARTVPPPRPSTRPRRAPRLAVARDFDDGDASGNVITDPGLLLDGFGSRDASSARPVWPTERRAPGILRPTEAVAVAAELASDQGPLLRPGERLQRTAGGSVVLRRGGQ